LDEKVLERLGWMREFTLEELSKYDGRDGNPAYVTCNGKVCDRFLCVELLLSVALRL